MLVSNKHFTPVIGLDIHIVILLGFPIPLPHPYIGLVIDPMDYIPFIGATTKVNHVPRGKSDTSGLIIILFHIPMGGPFLLAPMIGHDSVNFFGSKTVKVEGNLMSPSGHMLMTCNDIGIPLSLQPGKKLKPIPSMYLPTSFSIPLSFGKPVMVGGPYIPDWAGALLNLVMSFGFGALMKGLGKGLKKLGKAAKKAKRKITDFNLARQKSLGSNKLSGLLCKMGFEPVDLVQGIVVYEGTDFALPGPIPFTWDRCWNSDSTYEGPLGHGTHLSYDMRVLDFAAEEATCLLLGDGRRVIFDRLPYPGDSEFDRSERMTLTRSDLDEYLLFNHQERLFYHFRSLQPGDHAYRLYSITDEAGFMISFHYNNRGSLSRIIDSAGRHLQIENDHEGRITGVRAHHRGQQKQLVRYEYNAAGDMTAIIDALEQATRIQYHQHLMTKKTDRNGQSFYWEYDGQGRCVHTWGDEGVLEGWIEYNPKEGYNLVTNALGQTTTYYYTPDYLVTQIKDPLGNSRFTEYTEDAEIYREIDEAANVTGYAYDEKGNRTRIIHPDGSTVSFNYDEEDRLLLSVDAQGSSRSYVYYEEGPFKGLMHSFTEADGRMSIFTYNAGKLLVKVEDRQRNSTLLEYDEDHNITALILQNGGRSSWQYDAWGQCTHSINPLQQEQHFRYDLLGRTTEVLYADGNQLHLQYNAYNEVLEARDRNRHLRFAYTPLGSVRMREENGAKIHFLYNNAEQLTSLINEKGEIYRLGRNGRGDIIHETGFDGIQRHYHRDATGQVIRTERPNRRWTAYEYDVNGRVTRAEHSDGSWQTYSYDRSGQLIEAMNEHSTIRLQRDAMGRIVQEHQNEFTVSSTYDKHNRRQQVQSSLGAAILIARNPLGEVTGMQANVEGTLHPWHTDILRDVQGQEIERILPGGLESKRTYNQLGLPESHVATVGGNSTRRRHYSWDAAQQLKQIVNGLTHGAVKYSHDNTGNLTWAQYEDGQYDYRLPDKTGNIYRTQARNDRQYGPGGKLAESADARFIYDDEGFLIKKIELNAANAVWQYEWYGNGMLKKVTRPDSKVVEFRYDALGRRIEKQYKGQITRFVWDGNVPLHQWHYPASERPVIEIDELGDVRQQHPEPVPAENLITWIFEEGTLIPVARLTKDAQYSILSDHLGTPAEAYDASGEKVWEAELDIYGKLRKLAGASDFIPFRQQGQYEDAETGLYYNRFRYFSPLEGLYISQDPIRLEGGSRFYEYSRCPTLILDPFGLVDFYHATSSPGATKGVLGGVDPSTGRPNLDFNPSGQGGFYVTNDLEQARSWVRNGGSVIHYDIPESELAKLNIKTFDSASDEWADYVKQGRAGTLAHDFDGVEGPMIALKASKKAGKPKPVKLQPDGRLGHQLAIFTDKAAKLFDKFLKGCV